MSIRRLLSGCALLPLAVGASQAADLGVQRVSVPSAIAAPAFSWTGFYAGLNAGYTFGRSTATDAGDSQTPPVPWAVLGGRFSTNTSGFTGGAQAGYNWQFNNVVAGVEADVGYLGARGTGEYGLAPGTFIQARGGVDATFRGRLGFAADRALFYVTGGAIVAGIAADVSRPSTNFFGTRTGTQWGWTVGAGVEYAVAPQWSVRAEYLYYDLGSKTVVQNNGVGSRFDIRSNGNIVRVGVNYLFGSGASAVVARY